MVGRAGGDHDGAMSSIRAVRRSTEDHKVAGLCGGVAAQWGIDPVLVRIGWVLLALSGGVGLVLYLAGWLMVPEAGRTRTHLDEKFPRVAGWPRGVRVLLVVVVGVLVAVLLSPVLPFGLGTAAVLAAIWYFGYYRRHRRDPEHPVGDLTSDVPTPSGPPRTGPAPSAPAGPERPRYEYFTFTGPSTPFTEAASAWQQRMRAHERGWPEDPHGDGPGERVAAGPGTTVATPSRNALAARTPAARRLRLASVLVLGLTLSGLGVASALGAQVVLTTYLAAALLVAGLTLVAAAFVGRARGILPVAVLLAVVTGLSAVGGLPTNRHGDLLGAGEVEGVGIHQVHYATAATLPASEDWGSGRLVVDLGQLELSQDTAFSTHVDQGTLTLIVPQDVRVQVDSSIDDGYLRIGAAKGTWGSELSSSDTFPAGRPGEPVLTVHASVDSGVLEVRR